MITDKKIELVALSALDGGAKLRFHLKITQAGEVKSEVLFAFAARLSRIPRVGVLSEQAYEELSFEHRYGVALDVGLRVLGSGSYSRRQLVQKLCQRGIEKEIANGVTDELWTRGYGNEIDGALALARRNLLKLWGDRRILLDARAKGYDDVAIEAVAQMLQKEDAVARCAKLITKRYGPCPEDASARRRFVAALVRYGYTSQEIKAALKNNR